jgi:hypothetical protein
MVYTSLFITALSKVVNLSFGAIALTDLNDDVVKMADDRVIMMLGASPYWTGGNLTYQTLLSLDRVTFQPLLEYAAIFAAMSWCNQQGKANKTVGPITAASGDGMAKTQAYFTGKKINNDAMASSEENFLNTMRNIFRTYSAKRSTRQTMVKRYNEYQTSDYNASDYDTRKTEGNTY